MQWVPVLKPSVPGKSDQNASAGAPVQDPSVQRLPVLELSVPGGSDQRAFVGAVVQGSLVQRERVLELPVLLDFVLGASATSVPKAPLPDQRMMILPKVSAHFPMATVPTQNHAALPNPASPVQAAANSTTQAAHQVRQSPQAEVIPEGCPSVPVLVPFLLKAPVPVREAPARHTHVMSKAVPNHPESAAPFRARASDDTNSISAWERPGEVP